MLWRLFSSISLNIRQMCSACVHVLSLIIFFCGIGLGGGSQDPPPLGYAHGTTHVSTSCRAQGDFRYVRGISFLVTLNKQASISGHADDMFQLTHMSVMLNHRIYSYLCKQCMHLLPKTDALLSC